MKIQRFYQIAIFSQNLEESEAFYREFLGARFIQKYDPPGLLFFDFNGVRLLIEKGAPKSLVYFWVDDIDAAYQQLKDKGIEFSSEPHPIFRDETGVFGEPQQDEWMAFFNDPSGNTIALASRKPIVE